LARGSVVPGAFINKHVDRLVTLRHWGQPLKLDENRLSVHVLEAIDPAAAILEFAEANHVDHIVIGAPELAAARVAGQGLGEGGGGSGLYR
jgi:nucleotide-binding universal stress UspA family protein